MSLKDFDKRMAIGNLSEAKVTISGVQYESLCDIAKHARRAIAAPDRLTQDRSVQEILKYFRE